MVEKPFDGAHGKTPKLTGLTTGAGVTPTSLSTYFALAKVFTSAILVSLNVLHTPPALLHVTSHSTPGAPRYQSLVTVGEGVGDGVGDGVGAGVEGVGEAVGNGVPGPQDV